MTEMAAKEFVTTAFVKDGKFAVRNREAFAEFCADQNDGEYIVTVRRAVATRSPQQNAWYWSQIIGTLHRWSVKKEYGLSPDDWHDVCKMRFLPKRLALADGNGEIVAEFVVGGTTTRLNKQDFADYCEDIRRWAAEEFQLDIPDPDPFWRERQAEEAAA